MSKEGITLGIAVGVIAVLALASGKFTLFSASAPTDNSYDFKYDHVPTVYDAGAGSGYQQTYPDDLMIGEYAFPNTEVPLGSFKINEFIQVQKLVG